MLEEEFYEEQKHQRGEDLDQNLGSENDVESGNEESEALNPDSIEDYCQQYVESFQKSERSIELDSVQEGGDKLVDG